MVGDAQSVEWRASIFLGKRKARGYLYRWAVRRSAIGTEQGSNGGRAQGETAGKEDKTQVSVAGQDQMREKRENFDEYFLR